MTKSLKERVLAGAGAVARHVPLDEVQFFAFVASPAVRAEPYTLYRRLHQRGPVRPTRFPVWMVASHAGVVDVLREAPTSVQEWRADGMSPRDSEFRSKPFTAFVERTLLFTDPPDHARLRRLVAGAFTPKRIEALRPSIEAMVDDMLDRLRPKGSADLISEFALPLPVAVICELLGVPEAERPQMFEWARHLAPRFDLSLFRDAEKERLGDEAAVALESFLHELIADPARRDPNGLLSALVAVEQDGDRLTADEMTALAGLLLAAGFETTTNLIGNGVLALLRNPTELARLRAGDVDPASAVEELLRYETPVQFTQRVLLEDYEVGGRTIPARTLVALLLGAANRDPGVFDRPDRLDLARSPNPHLAFSSGIHHCLGASLARLEGAIAFPALLRGLPGLRLAGRPVWRETFVLRGLSSLPVGWTGAD